MNSWGVQLPGRGVTWTLLLCWLVYLAGCEQRGERREVVAFPQSFAELVQKVSPAVVNISTTTTVTIPGTPFDHFFGGPGIPFQDFFDQIPDRQITRQSLGSGVIVDKEGYIITNNHVVRRAEAIKVRLSDGRELPARVVGRDPKTDLALIKVDPGQAGLPVLALGDSQQVRVGDWVLAVGNPFGLEQTVTQGIISATGRAIGSGPYDDFLQTDAPINPGNSGGPLINLKGEVIGINTAIFAGGQGLGFAIPSRMAGAVADQLKKQGRVVRGWIGVTIQRVTPELARTFGLKEPGGALVSQVQSGAPADQGGVRAGDILLSFDGKPVTSSDQLPRLVAETPVGKKVEVAVLRQGKDAKLSLVVAQMPEGPGAAAGRPRGGMGNYGLGVEELTPGRRKQFGTRAKSGVIAVLVEPGSPAEEAGIRPGDLVREVNRQPVRNLAEFRRVLARTAAGSPLLLLLTRGEQTLFAALLPQPG